MLKHALLICVTAIFITACSESKEVIITPEKEDLTVVALGNWITQPNGNVMFDPQTSGLVAINDTLLTIADASADKSQQLKLHSIDPETSTLLSSSNTFSFSPTVRKSCFYNYLSTEPDLEALVVDPRDTNVIYTVTEDATRTGALSPRCESKYSNTGSTDYPTLLVRLARKDNGDVAMTHVRPLQFPVSFNVGNFPNDGIEGLAMASDGTVYLGLEKDIAGQPRIFSVTIDDDFFTTTDFAIVEEPDLLLPQFSSGNHPINGLTLHTVNNHSALIAAARNDDELWIIDAAGEKATLRVPVTFKVKGTESCEDYVMDNASMEGLVVMDNMLWIINDPWEKNYLKNASCKADEDKYKDLAPLLFSVPLNDAWFQ
ncbi:hypothetical protein ACOJR9_15920 [Alteromonas sp. A081]|uniref:hypothetical protein n=1 Tax=Alteromonas sp. A081 TaxID=3410269 RepID=UPI003B98766C